MALIFRQPYKSKPAILILAYLRAKTSFAPTFACHIQGFVGANLVFAQSRNAKMRIAKSKPGDLLFYFLYQEKIS